MPGDYVSMSSIRSGAFRTEPSQSVPFEERSQRPGRQPQVCMPPASKRKRNVKSKHCITFERQEASTMVNEDTRQGSLESADLNVQVAHAAIKDVSVLEVGLRWAILLCGSDWMSESPPAHSLCPGQLICKKNTTALMPATCYGFCRPWTLTLVRDLAACVRGHCAPSALSSATSSRASCTMNSTSPGHMLHAAL